MSFSFSLYVRFLAIFQFLQCAFLIYTFFSVSRHTPGHTVCVSHFTHFSVFSQQSSSNSFCLILHVFLLLLTIFQDLHCVFLILHFFQCFLPYFMYWHMSFSFSSFVTFLTIFQVLQGAFLIFHIFHCFSPRSTDRKSVV